MADFVAPQASFSTDVLGAYLRAQAAPIQMQAAQQQIAQSQQAVAQSQQAMGQQAQLFPGQLAGQGLSLEQTRIALQNARMYQQYAQQAIGQQGTQSAGAQSAAGPAGGIQSGPQTSVQGSASQSGSFDGSVSGFTPTTLSALAILRGDDPLKTAQGVQDYQLQQRKIQAQGPMNLAETVASSPQADVIIRNNPDLQQRWFKGAPALGIDPYWGLSPNNPEAPLNARKFATFAYNTLAGAAGMPAKPMPTMMQNQNGTYGERDQTDPLTGKTTVLAARDIPTSTQEKVYDPDTGTTTLRSIQTAGLDAKGRPVAGGPPVLGGQGGAVLSGNGGNNRNLGYPAPTAPEAKAAMFGSEMRSGLKTMQQMETGGFSLSVPARSLLINAATSDNDSMMKQLLSQESLSKFSPQTQAYMAATMPLLQAAGHDQSGARLSTAQIRQNLESLLPPAGPSNKQTLDQVNANRQGFYTGILTQAGSAIRLPQYANTLAADLKKTQQQAQSQTKVLGGKTYVSLGNGRWAEQ